MLVFHFLLSVGFSVSNYWWVSSFYDQEFYLRSANNNTRFEGLTVTGLSRTFFTAFCLNSTFIPISLLVSVECVKMFQAMNINADAEMFTTKEDDSI